MNRFRSYVNRMMNSAKGLVVFSTMTTLAFSAANAQDTVPWTHGIAMHGKPELAAGYTHLPYANPDAPKGGRLSLGVQGTFDSLNSYALKGAWTSARGMKERQIGSYILESLLLRSDDEAFSLYSHLAEAVRMPDERNWIEFRLNPAAKFSNGDQLGVEDIIFSLETIRDHGRPPFARWYSKIVKFEKTGERMVKLHFKDGSDRELPFLIALAPIFNSRTTNAETFGNTTLTPPVGTGPYIFSEINPGRRTTYTRRDDYWAKDLPQKIGFDNFDEVTVDYFRDYNALQEAFRKGGTQALIYSNPGLWENAGNFPAFEEGKVVKDVFERKTPSPMTGIAFNTRRTQFADKRVREALGMLLDFQWINRSLFGGLYQRTDGYWDNSVLSSIGRPASELEKKILQPFPNAVSDDVLAGTWRPSQADGSGRDRQVLREALALFKQAGYELNQRKLVNAQTGEQFAFEILVRVQDEEKVALALQRTAKLLGIEISVRFVDAAQFEARRSTFDFDALFNTWSASLSPGGEQFARWSSEAADTPNSRNIVGAKEPAIDALLDALVAARSREEFIATVRAFDRVLISGYYAIPLYHAPAEWVARWTTVEHPAKTPLYGMQYNNWWEAPKE
ncbi:Oligopeptide-binding protein AppA precursor [Pseudovibrio axinellae]|uniref:Oligopeptide-binding protein AppA n=1 Tax=Pseudovibrio axinellae TaxID=989403 RepID=A0A165XBI0_9HYPH|nr:extracellular solute-binding protein [Pseudovibrio axinellae]KZL17547.1 Oligopeptide-binding protein AppA precursor [Pseudovibrio axinellae]SER33106.1 peptide/nickel transport system substrate-binding protein [Pseudovibrio axinellae]